MTENLQMEEGTEMVDIQVTRRGRAPGTSGWLAQRLQGARVVLSKTHGGRPAAFLKMEGKEESFTLVIYGEEMTPGDYWRYYEEEDGEYRLQEWLACRPTDAVEDAIHELATLAEERLDEWMDSDNEKSLAFQLLIDDAATNDVHG